ncbi:MAG: hypothetical protein ABI200_01505 [Gaiellales bacterium]
MSASSSSPVLRIALVALIVFSLGALVAGCTVPGKSHFVGTPKNMPPSLHYLPGDALGWIMVDTNGKRADAQRLEQTLGTQPDTDLAGPILVGLIRGDGPNDIDTWVGHAAGIVRYTARSGEPSKLTFVDVAHVGALEKVLHRSGWTRTATQLDAGRGHQLRLWTRAGTAKDELGAIGVASDALVGAKTRTDLAALVKDTKRYSADQRASTIQYTIDALKSSPISIVFRSDQVRSDLRTLVNDNPAFLEMSRWLTKASSIYALRDGWIGAVPASGARAKTDIHLIGRMDWARSATQVPEPKGVPRPKPADLVGADWAVEIANPGSYAQDVVNAISDGGNQFVTKLDDPKGTPKLDDLLNKLDGPALITGHKGYVAVTVQVKDPTQTEQEAKAAIKLAGIGDWVDVANLGAGTGLTIDVQTHRGTMMSDAVATTPKVAAEMSDQATQIFDTMNAAGKAPSQPVAWVYQAKSPCDAAHPAAGWISWDSTSQRLTYSFDVPVVQGVHRAVNPCSTLAGA